MIAVAVSAVAFVLADIGDGTLIALAVAHQAFGVLAAASGRVVLAAAGFSLAGFAIFGHEIVGASSLKHLKVHFKRTPSIAGNWENAARMNCDLPALSLLPIRRIQRRGPAKCFRESPALAAVTLPLRLVRPALLSVPLDGAGGRQRLGRA